MKKLIFLLLLLPILFSSCCNEEDCMKYHFGTVLVVNQTGVTIWVDVTTDITPIHVSNKVTMLEDGQSVEYRMTAGRIRLKTSRDYDKNIVEGATWISYDDKLGICEIYECPWSESDIR